MVGLESVGILGGYYVYLQHGTSVCWQFKPQLESADLSSTLIYSYKSLKNNVIPIHSLTHSH